MAATATATKPAPAQAQQMAARPFITGSRQIESHTYDETKSMQAGSVSMPKYDLVTDGYVSGLYIWVQATTSANAATVAFKQDAPWNMLGVVEFADVSNRPIAGPWSGWELKTAVKFGGYSICDDPQNSVTYTATAGAGATGGSATFMLVVPIEFVHRNALGSLTNLSNAAVFRLNMTLAAATDVYSTAPTTNPSVRVRIHQEGWMESAGHDPFGNPSATEPPAVDSVQYWEKQSYTVNAGSQNFRLTPFEGHVRNLIFVMRDSTGDRIQGDADWPDPLRLHYDATVPVDRLKDIWKRKHEEWFGYVAAAPATAANQSAALTGGESFRDPGVWVLPYNRDFGLRPGAEQGFGYMYVSSGTALRFDGTIGGSGAHSMDLLINYINPAGGNALALTGGR